VTVHVFRDICLVNILLPVVRVMNEILTVWYDLQNTSDQHVLVIHETKVSNILFTIVFLPRISTDRKEPG
jgi:hypothetical protein